MRLLNFLTFCLSVTWFACLLPTIILSLPLSFTWRWLPSELHRRVKKIRYLQRRSFRSACLVCLSALLLSTASKCHLLKRRIITHSCNHEGYLTKLKSAILCSFSSFFFFVVALLKFVTRLRWNLLTVFNTSQCVCYLPHFRQRLKGSARRINKRMK